MAARYSFGVMYLRTSPIPSLSGAWALAGAGVACAGLSAGFEAGGSAACTAPLKIRVIAKASRVNDTFISCLALETWARRLRFPRFTATVLPAGHAGDASAAA